MDPTFPAGQRFSPSPLPWEALELGDVVRHNIAWQDIRPLWADPVERGIRGCATPEEMPGAGARPNFQGKAWFVFFKIPVLE